MNTRSSLLTVGVSALLLTGSAFAAAPATAAPNSAECLAAQSALGVQLGAASVDLTIANELRAAVAVIDVVGPQLGALWAAAEASLADEEAAIAAAETAINEAIFASEEADKVLRAAQDDQEEAQELLTIAETALAADPTNPDLIEAEATAQRTFDAAVLAVTEAQRKSEEAAAAIEPTFVAVEAAYEALEAASIAAFNTPEILALVAQDEEARAAIDALLAALGATEGTDPAQLIALADAAIAACSGAAVKPAVVVAAPQRGLNVQTAAVSTAGATDPAGIALLGFVALGAVGAASAVVVRRRSAARS